MPCKQKYCNKNMAVKIPILILFRFCLLADLKTIYFASCFCCSTSCFNCKDPCRWFQMVLCRFRSFQLVPQMVLACFRWFQLVLGVFRSFQLVPHFNKYRFYIDYDLIKTDTEEFFVFWVFSFLVLFSFSLFFCLQKLLYIIIQSVALKWLWCCIKLVY